MNHLSSLGEELESFRPENCRRSEQEIHTHSAAIDGLKKIRHGRTRIPFILERSFKKNNLELQNYTTIILY